MDLDFQSEKVDEMVVILENMLSDSESVFSGVFSGAFIYMNGFASTVL